jgi:hypothetical protein
MKSGEGRLLLIACSVFALLNALAWSRAIPFGTAPDEVAHFEVVDFEARYLRIPEVGVDAPAATVHVALDGYRYPYYTYAAQPGLSYIVSAAMIRLTGSVSPRARVAAARLPGAVYGALFVLVVFAGVRRIIPGVPIAADIATVLAATWPQLTFIFSYVSNDGLTTLACAVLLTQWHRSEAAGWGRDSALLCGAAAGLVLLNKPNGFVLVALTPVVIVLTLDGWRPRAVALARVGVAALVISGWWYAIAWSRYGLDVFAGDRSAQALEQLGAAWPSARFWGLSFVETLYVIPPRADSSFLTQLGKSFVGLFGTMSLPLPQSQYWLVLLGVLFAFAGLWRGDSAERPNMSKLALLTLVAPPVLLFLFTWGRSYRFDFQPQGRYLFPSILPLFAALGLGFALTGGRRLIVLRVVTAALLLINLLALMVTIVPSYNESTLAWIRENQLLSVAVGVMAGGVFAATWRKRSPL